MKDCPLSVAVEGDELVIRIGIDTLAFSAEHCPLFYNEEKHMGAMGPYVKVEDKVELAKDVIRAMQHEEEDGSTPLSDMFDKAIEDAAEDGSCAFTEDSFA